MATKTATSVSIDPFSPRSSTGSSVNSGSSNSSALPQRRIRCSKTQIAIGENRFDSASDALVAYLTQFEDSGQIEGEYVPTRPLVLPKATNPEHKLDNETSEKDTNMVRTSFPQYSTANVVNEKKESLTDILHGHQGGRANENNTIGKGLAGSGLILNSNGISVAGAKEDVENLLTSKVNEKVKEEVTDTLREVKLRRLLKQAALKSKTQTTTGLQQEVEAALIRSAELLEKVTRENMSSSKCSSQTNIAAESVCNSATLNTELEALLLGNNSHMREDNLTGDNLDDARTFSSLPPTPRSTSQNSSHKYSYYTSSRQPRSRHRPSDSIASHILNSSSQSQRSAPVSFQRQSRTTCRRRASSIDSLFPPPTPSSVSLNTTLQLLLNPKDLKNKKDALVSPSSSDSVPSNQSDPTDLLRQIRSRSMSPYVTRGSRSPRTRGSSSSSASIGSPTGPDWVHQLDESVRKSVPSWIGEVNGSEVSDSAWVHEGLLADENNMRPRGTYSATLPPKVPSWIGQAEHSEGEESHTLDSSRHLLVPMMSTPIKQISIEKANHQVSLTNDNASFREEAGKGNFPLKTHNFTNDLSGPGLNYSDLNTSTDRNQNNSIKHVTFTDSLVDEGTNNKRQLSSSTSALSSCSKKYNFMNSSPSEFDVRNDAKPTDLSKNQRPNLDLTSPRPSRVLDSDYIGETVLRNSILPQAARLKKSMDTFKASSENLGRRSASSSASSECSGGSGGASSPSKVTSSLDTVALLHGQAMTRSQFHRQRGRASDQGSSSDGLDGDRSWERLVNTIKSPVPVGEENDVMRAQNGHSFNQNLESTLSGGKQPGSMEALKNMLFKLQAEESSTHDEADRKPRNDESANSKQHKSGQSNLAIIPALENYDFRQEPGGHSLEKALVHLNRLKNLVKASPTQATTDGETPQDTPTDASSL